MVSSDEESYDSDTALQELFAAGKIKPGLNIPVKKKVFANNIKTLKEKLESIKTDLLWSERLDITTDLAPIAPELTLDIMEKEEAVKSGRSDSLALNEFKRETMFHRRAQAAVAKCIPKLRSHGIPITRPDDYFAQMMKSDEHMQKVRRSLLQRQAGLERSEIAKKVREQKKLAKQKQIESTLRKQKEKKELSEQIKKYRKGTLNDLNFLNEGKKREKSAPMFNRKRAMKDRKFGFGGKKRGIKKNQNTKNLRPGKNRRNRMKNKN